MTVMAIILIFVLFAFGGIAVGLGMKEKPQSRTLGKVILSVLVSLLVGGGFFLAFVFSSLFFPKLLLGALPYGIGAFCFFVILSLNFKIWDKNTKPYKLAVTLALCCCLAVICIDTGMKIYKESIPKVGEGNILRDYRPYSQWDKTVSLNEPSTLIITEDLPVMDGATALYPIYAAFAKAIYPEETFTDIDYEKGETLMCTTTTYAYESLMNAQSDIIFVAAPSAAQLEKAESMGLEFEMTPIGREAFVFFVNSQNTVEELSLEQIRGIYSGKITKWSEVGGDLGKIRAFQRDEGSGSQSALQRLMGEVPLMEAPTEHVVGGMSGIIEKTSDYRNYKNAIGYSFRFYSTEMVKNDSIKLLRIEGVYPDAANIENGTYPITNSFYAVTVKGRVSENTKKLLEWICGEQGQYIVEQTGYVPNKVD